MGDWTRMRMWLLAIAVAMLGANALELAGLSTLSNSILHEPNFTWLSYLVGGFLFGFGMALGSGCGSKTLIRVGGGNLKSIVVFVFLAISGVHDPARRVRAVSRRRARRGGADVLDPAGPAALAAGAIGFGRGAALVALLIVIARRLARIRLREAGRTLAAMFCSAGIVIGLVVAAGWYVTGVLGYVAEHPDTLKEAFVGTNTGRMESLSFVAPQAFLLELLMLVDRQIERSSLSASRPPSGVIAGSLLYALATNRTFRLEASATPRTCSITSPAAS